MKFTRIWTEFCRNCMQLLEMLHNLQKSRRTIRESYMKSFWASTVWNTQRAVLAVDALTNLHLKISQCRYLLGHNLKISNRTLRSIPDFPVCHFCRSQNRMFRSIPDFPVWITSGDIVWEPLQLCSFQTFLMRPQGGKP